MDFRWEKVINFGSLRELDRFRGWMQDQIAGGQAKEIAPPGNHESGVGDRWFEHIPSGEIWRLVSAEDPLGPGFWPLSNRGDDPIDNPSRLSRDPAHNRR